jgi:hypothetical protein
VGIFAIGIEHPLDMTVLQAVSLSFPLRLQPQLYKPADGFRGRMPSFLDRLFGFLNFMHAADHERRKIAFRNLFFVRLFPAEPLPHKLSLSLLRGLSILRGDNWLVERKGKGRKKHRNQHKKTNSAQTVTPISSSSVPVLQAGAVKRKMQISGSAG